MSQPPNMNASPKARFQEASSLLGKHRDFVTSAEFNRAMDFGLLQLQAELCAKCDSPDKAMSVGMRLLGAQELIQIVKNLAVTQPAPPRPVDANLQPTN